MEQPQEDPHGPQATTATCPASADNFLVTFQATVAFRLHVTPLAGPDTYSDSLAVRSVRGVSIHWGWRYTVTVLHSATLQCYSISYSYSVTSSYCHNSGVPVFMTGQVGATLGLDPKLAITASSPYFPFTTLRKYTFCDRGKIYPQATDGMNNTYYVGSGCRPISAHPRAKWKVWMVLTFAAPRPIQLARTDRENVRFLREFTCSTNLFGPPCLVSSDPP